MRTFVLATALLAATATFAQQPPGTPPAAPPPGEGQPVTPVPTPQNQTPGMQPDRSMPPTTNPNPTPVPTAPGPGSTPGQMAPGAPMSSPAAPQGTRAMAPRQAMTDYPVCSAQQRDGCRQPDGRRAPAPR